MNQKKVTLVNPFDAHAHFRQGEVMKNILPYTMNQFAGAVAMPNTKPSIISMHNLVEYRCEVSQNVDEKKFLPIFTLYLSPELDLDEVKMAWDKKLFYGIKYYPKGGTTNSEKGVLGFKKVAHILHFMGNEGIPLLIHGETQEMGGKLVDDFKRESVFYKEEMRDFKKTFPKIKIVLEHITTQEAVTFAMNNENVRATITPQHLLFDLRSLFNYNEATADSYRLTTDKSGIFPDFVCRPLLKSEEQVSAVRNALVWQSRNGQKIFGLGTDTAYHPTENKYCECGACGMFTAPIALELYAMAFDQMGILDHLPTFACDIMPEFYGIKEILPKKTVILSKEPRQVENHYYNATTPFAGQVIPWSAKIE